MSSFDKYTFTLRDEQQCLLRSATRTDAPDIFAIVRAWVIEDGSDLNTLEDLPTEEHEFKWVEMLIQGEEKVLIVAEVEEEIIGFISFNNGHLRRLAHQGEISIGIKAGWRDQGLGRRLFTALFAWTEQHPRIEKIGLGVVANNERAIHLYRALGFAEEGRLKQQVKLGEGQYVDLLLMSKWLGH